MIYIRADANSVIATGHIMRCMAIAIKLREHGEQVTFLVADEYPLEMLNEKGFQSIVLHTDWKDMDSELPVLKKLIEERKIEKLFVDSYQVTDSYFRKLKNLVKTIYLDDRNLFRCDVSDIINYSHYYQKFGYEKTYAGSAVKLWLGCQYVPLREEFSNMQEKEIADEVRNVMVTTGGTDSYNVSECILQLLAEKYPEITFHLVIGRFFKNADRLKGLKGKLQNIRLYEKIPSMSALMNASDIAISAGGTTLYELCACGVPTICFSMADNQVTGVEAMAEQNIMLSAGDIRNGQQIFDERLLEQFHKILDGRQRLVYSRVMQKYVDGQGTERIAQIII